MILFQYPLNLHCSQTKCKSTRFSGRFQYPLNLHCSQTNSQNNLTPNPFQYPLNLHCSQTTWNLLLEFQCFNTLWIYTALKQVITRKTPFIVSIPSEFTLLSNRKFRTDWQFRFQYPLNLHCSQTILNQFMFCPSFNTLWIYTALKHNEFAFILKLCFNTLWIYTALKPRRHAEILYQSFNTLWIYTALKHSSTKYDTLSVSIPSEFTLLSNYIF